MSNAPEDEAWAAIVADLSADTELIDGGQRLRVNDPTRPDAFVDELLDEGPLAADAFIPDEPPPIPRPRDAIARFAWAGVIGGPLLAIASTTLAWGGIVSGAGVVAFVAGFVTLIARKDDEPYGDRDDGAVV